MEALSFSPDGLLVASGSTDGRVIVWDLGEGQPVYVLDGHDPRVGQVAFRPDGRVLATLDVQAVRLWDAGTGRPLERKALAGALTSMAWAADGTSIVIGRRDGRVVTWEPGREPGEPRRVADRPVLTVATKGSQVAAAGEGGWISAWEPGAEVRKLPHHPQTVLRIAWLPDGRRLLSAGTDGTVRITPVPPR